MPRNRSTHRPTRETPAKEIAQLKQENRSLKKKVAALRKQVEQGVSTVPDIEEYEIPSEQQERKWRCLNCDSPNLQTFTTPGGKEIRFCAGCKTRLDDAA